MTMEYYCSSLLTTAAATTTATIDLTTCFKRHDAVAGDRPSKKPSYHHHYCPPPPPPPRCQVEGCDAVLVTAKEYHRRHKVCEHHAKAPRAVVHGADQRFCQQCSRFHEVAEFDDSKRSCRRRLAGHNQRRRKRFLDYSTSPLLIKKPSQDIKVTVAGGDSALSLLSSPETYGPASNSLPPPSAALRELIAENRASVLAARRQLINPTDAKHYHEEDRYGRWRELSWGRAGQVEGVMMGLMRAPDTVFGLSSVNNSDESNRRPWLRDEGNGRRGM